MCGVRARVVTRVCHCLQISVTRLIGHGAGYPIRWGLEPGPCKQKKTTRSDHGEMEREGMGGSAGDALAQRSVRSIHRGGARSSTSYAAPRRGQLRPPGGKYRTSGTWALAIARGGGSTTIDAVGRSHRRRSRAARRRALIPRRPVPWRPRRRDGRREGVVVEQRRGG